MYGRVKLPWLPATYFACSAITETCAITETVVLLLNM
uniref:Uncharacterized protein n=1 Tax=Anguilla anguilla TaxID=7936 RepID=A0A0E9SG62_ANGAN